MKNELFSIGPITIYGYGLMIAIGVLAAYFSATYRAKKYDLDPDKVFYVTVWAVIGGFGGAKLLYLITQLPAILQDPSLLKDVQDGFVVYGGIIGGILAAWIYCKVAKLKFMKYFDLVMPSVALAQGFGRIGCFLAGCCYGKETESAFHIIFHDSAYAPNNVPLIPTQLISSCLDFLNCIFLMWFAGKKKGDGPGGRAVSGLLQCGKICPGILPWGSGKGKCGKFVHIPVYRDLYSGSRCCAVFLVWKKKNRGEGDTGRDCCRRIICCLRKTKQQF